MVKCQDIKYDLALFADGNFEHEGQSRIEEHLAKCPLCRQKLAEYRSLGRDLRDLRAAAKVPGSLVARIRTGVAALSDNTSTPRFGLIEPKRRWMDTWMLPSAAGSMAALVIGFSMLWGIFSGPNSIPELDSKPESAEVTLARSIREPVQLTPLEYASTRRDISGESPSVNPQGALVALTRSLVRGEMKDEEVVVVADVFGNGIARIAEVVEPANDRRAIEELQKALNSDPDFAPFVPARFDQRGEAVRVVLKIQNVNVSTDPASPNL